MAEKQTRPLVAVFVSTLGYFFLAATGACSKLVSKEISIFSVLFFQNSICLLLTLPQVYQKGFSSVKTNKVGLHLFRDVLGISCFWLLFESLKYTSLVTSMLFFNTAPFWVPLAAFFWLKVKMRGNLWWGILLGFVGVVLILHPGAQGSFSPGALLALGAGMLGALILIVIGKLSHTEPTHRILFYYFLVGTLVTAPLGLTVPHGIDLWLLISVGLFTFLNQLFGTYAFQHGKAELLAPTVYTAVVFSAFFDWLLWDKIPDPLACTGIITVIAGALISLHFEMRYKKKIGG